MPPYLISVSLTSNTCDDHRTLDLIPNKAYIIGRASKNKQDMQAEPGNALFDCAVVSREHAELRSSPWQPPGKQVTLTDKRSLHGTTVNGRRLVPNSPFALKTGDVIKFGEKVARGDEAHDGVSVTFHQVQPDHQSSYRQPVSTSNVRGFHVPDDSEQSDYLSEDESFVTNPHDRSSAKTTPEQAKMGSQKQPIDLEETTASHRKVISLVDDDELTWLDHPEVPSASRSAPRGTVPESILAESLLVSDSLATAKTPGTVDEFDINDSDFDDDDDESVLENNTGLSRNLSHEEAASEGEQENDEEAALDEGDEYAGYDQEEDEDIYSLDGSPEPSDVESEQDVSANEVSPSSIPRRQTSEELGEPSAPAQKPSWLDELVKQAAAAPKPRYDPVRSSQPPDELAANSSTAAQSPPSTYTYYSPYTYGLSSANLATDLSGSTRWDLQPASASAQSTVESTYMPMSPAYQHPGQATFGTWQIDVATQEESADFFSRPQTTQTFVETSSATAAPLCATDSSSKGKLSIPNLLQPRASAPEQSPVGSMPTQTFAEPLTQAALPASSEVTQALNSTKRKASEVEDMQAAEPASKKVATVDAATGTRRAIAVPARMRSEKSNKHSLARRVAGAAVKYTASATLGAAATVAFLNSTYAEQLIQYLS